MDGPDFSRRALARTAGLRDLDTPELEDVNRRRAQLWTLSLLVGLALPAAIVALGYDVLATRLGELIDVRVIRLILLALLVALFGYVAERERVLRELTTLLVDERVLTTALVAKVDELDLLVHASRAMNSSLQLERVLEVILRSACELLSATEGSIQLVDPEDPTVLRVAAIQGTTTAQVGQRQGVHEGLAGKAAAARDALLVTGPYERSRSSRVVGSAIVVPLQHRDELLGVLNLSVPAGNPEFTQFQLRSVAVFAETASSAIANARAHEQRTQELETLTELDRLKDEFLTLVTHELRTPLTSLIGVASTIVNHADRLETEQVRHLSEMTLNQAWRLERLVADLLQSSAAHRGTLELTPERCDLVPFLGELVEAIDAGAAGHTVRFEAHEPELVRTVDPEAIARIVMNLVGNAIKYSPEGSAVDVELRPWADGVSVTVNDQGPGIPTEERAALFAKFRRGPAAAATSGLGLGLYIVRSLAEAHGGGAVVESGRDGGCAFVVTLAALPATGEPAAVELAQPAAPAS